MKKRSFILLLGILVWPLQHALSQFGFEYNDSIEVIRGPKPLAYPWGGGLNYPQVSDFDFDFDGDLDLFIFDRSREEIRVLSQEFDIVPYYKPVYNAAQLFPNDIRYRATMVDYDYDGRKDLWCYGIGGLKVYRNIGDLANGLQWEVAKDLVMTDYLGNYVNLYVSSSDIPAIVDVDFDGDIDVLTFHQGGKYLEYHQNQSMELYGIPDSLVFELKNECWGKFSEDAITNNVLLNDPNAPCVGGSIPNPLRNNGSDNSSEKKHSGSSVLALDVDNSGVLDVVLGDVSYQNLNLLINGGSAPNTDSPMISQDPAFPSNTTSVDVPLFPAGFYVDVTFDNVKDLIVAPNAKNVSQNEESVWFYLNFGSDSNPIFVFDSQNYFQKEMIEHGTGSVPVFFDYNEDGLEDMFVANFYRYIQPLDKESAIAYYQNTGTANNPQFTYVDFNFHNLNQENFGLHMIPTFGDIDGDNDEDMILGLENGTVVFYENSSVGAGAIFGAGFVNYPDDIGFPISSGAYAHPQLFDLNQDSLLDLVLGNKDGTLVYYENVGGPTTPSFQLKNDSLGMISISSLTPDGYTAPHFFRHNDTTILFLGTVDGNLIYYKGIDGNLNPGDTFELVSDQYLDLDVSGYSSFAVNDIDSDGNYNLFVGQDLGGIYHFEANPNSNIGIEELNLLDDLMIYPNPANDIVNFSMKGMQIAHVELFDLKGDLLLSKEINNQQGQVAITKLSNGCYLMRFELDNGMALTQRLIKH